MNLLKLMSLEVVCNEENLELDPDIALTGVADAGAGLGVFGAGQGVGTEVVVESSGRCEADLNG